MTLERPEVVLARRQAEVDARPHVPDPLEESIKRDLDRQRQLAARTNAPAPSQEDTGEAEGGDPAPEESPPRYTIEQSGTWYKLIDPDGNQVGKSQRSEADAWALLESEELDG